MCGHQPFWKSCLPAWIISISWVLGAIGGFRWRFRGKSGEPCYQSVVKCCIAPGWSCTCFQISAGICERRTISAHIPRTILDSTIGNTSTNATYPAVFAFNCDKPSCESKNLLANRRSVCKKNATYFASVADGFIYIFCDAKCSLKSWDETTKNGFCMIAPWLHGILSSIYSFTPWRNILIPELNTHHERHAEDLQVSGGKRYTP